MILVVAVFGYAIAANYTVESGDTLSGIAKKCGISLSLLKALNPQIKNFDQIYPGQSINLNGEIQSNESSSEGKVWRKVGANPYTGTHWRAIESFGLPSFVKDAALKNFDNDNFEWVRIESGMHLDAVTFGRDEIWENVLTEWDVTKLYAAKDFGTDDYVIARVEKCGNWVWWKRQPKPIVVAEKPQALPVARPAEEVLETKAELPPIFKEVPIEKSCVKAEHEFDLGGGAWTNEGRDATGDWWFAQYKWFLHGCKDQIHVADGVLTPVVGLFAKGDRGDTDAGYQWNNWGVGPQVGVMWNGTTAAGYPQQIQLMLRAIYFNMHGKNRWSGYSKEQEHILVGYYLEYLRRFHPEYMTVLYAEGWFDVGSSYKSTWNGDSANDLTQFVVGAKLHKDLTNKWAARLGAQVGYNTEENRVIANAHLELRYDDWLIFGPSADYCLESDIATEAHSWVMGVFARVELRHTVIEKYTEYQLRQVTPSDKQLLEY